MKKILSSVVAASALLIATTLVATPRGGGGGGGSMGRGGTSMGRGGSSMGRGGSSMGRGGSSMGRGGTSMGRGQSMGRAPSGGRTTSMGRGQSMGRAPSGGRGTTMGRGLSPRNGGGGNGNWNNGGHDGNWNNGGHGGHGGNGHGHGNWHGGSGWNWGWGWGWGWAGGAWNWGWGWGWGYPGYGYYGVYAPYYGYGYGYPYGGYGYGGGGGYYGAAASEDWGAVKTDVSPEEARIMLDGRYIGTADDFDGYPDMLYLKPGNYHLEFQLEGFEPQSVDIEARAGVRAEINNKLKKIPGAKAYGSYDTPVPEGGVQRFFGKSKNSVAAINVETDSGYGSDWRSHDSSNQPADGNQDAPPMAPPTGKSYDDPPPPDAESRSAQPASPVPGGKAKARLVFRVEPPDAAVYVDDRFAGTGEELSSLTRGLQIAPGMHRIVVSRPGFASESTQVDAEAGHSETVEIRLERP